MSLTHLGAEDVCVVFGSRRLPALWRGSADDVSGAPLAGGPFFPEELPQQSAEALRGFFAVG